MEQKNEIISVENHAGSRGRSEGIYIKFSTNIHHSIGDYCQLDYNNKQYYFEVISVEVANNKVVLECVEIGYWAKKLDREEDIDYLDIINTGELKLITDEKLKAEIYEESCWM